MVKCRWVLPSQKVLLNGAVLDQWFSQGIPRPRHCLGVCYRTHFQAQTSRIRYFVASENEPPQAALMLGFRSHPINHTCINLSQRGTVHWVSIHPGPIDQGRRLDSGAHLDPTCFPAPVYRGKHHYELMCRCRKCWPMVGSNSRYFG